MLQQAKQEVPSLELGPPSPDWMDQLVASPSGGLKPDWMNQLVASPSGGLKPATRHESGLSLTYESTWMQLTTESVVGRNETRVQESPSPGPQPRHRPVAPETSSVSQAGTTSCEFRKRTKSLSSRSSSKRYAKRRRVVPAGAKTPPPTTESEAWTTALTANALSETFLAPSTMDTERDATEEFMNEFWGDLMLDTSPVSNDSLIAGACLSDELRTPLTPLPAAQPDSRLLDDVTEDQLLELAEYLEPSLSEADTAALAELPPPPAPAPATAEAPVAAPIDLAALLEQTEIVFSPELSAAAEPTTIQSVSLLPTPTCPPSPPPPPAPAASAVEPTHYLLVLSTPEQETPAAAALSVTSDEPADDPEFDDDDDEAVEVEEASGPARKRAPRRPPAATPAEKYRRIRDNNNEASRRSRQQRKLREVDTEGRAGQLEEENGRLRQQVEVLESLLEQVKALTPLLTAKR